LGYKHILALLQSRSPVKQQSVYLHTSCVSFPLSLPFLLNRYTFYAKFFKS
jgi:hypothetical protein